jgi:sugar phosphate isomerase/epimerase
MGRPVTLFTGQWADLPLEKLAQMASEWGYDGLELACWGDHFDVEEAAANTDYCKSRRELLAKYGLNVWAISNHLAGQLVLDLNDDARSDGFAPDDCVGDAEKKKNMGD